MKFELPDAFPTRAVGPAVFAATGVLCLALSIWSANAIERFSKLGVRRALAEAGQDWVEVNADGLQLILSGTAPTEALRLRALSIAGGTVDSSRLRDAMQVADRDGLAAPEFKIEMLRNDDGLSLIGLAPTAMDRKGFVATLGGLTGEGQLVDMLEAADQPVPEGWEAAVGYATDALALLPRAKVTITPGRVAITAISDSPAQKREIEGKLKSAAPRGLAVALDISAPRPVIAPFTLRFLVDADGARFDACSADSEKARARILSAATEAGVTGQPACTIGLGVPTPDWAAAVAMGIGALKTLGQGSITFSDADVALIAGPDVAQADFDSVVGDLESNLPPVFSLKASQTAADQGVAAAVEFTAVLDQDARVELTGRLRDTLTRDAIESYAQSRFGTKSVHAATRVDETMPAGWSNRVLVALAALSELTSGKVVVHENDLSIEGVSGSPDSSGTVARILSSRLGATGKYRINVRYDARLDPTAGLPSDQECVDRVNAILSGRKIAFEPGSAVIAPEAKDTIDKIAGVMKDCSDYPIEIGGHTDSQGREEMNLVLSEQRARAVIAALQSHRILTGNLTAVGYGETQPVMANDTEANREKNRRIEFRLLAPAATAAGGDGGDAAEVTVRTPDKQTMRPKKRPARND